MQRQGSPVDVAHRPPPFHSSDARAELPRLTRNVLLRLGRITVKKVIQSTSVEEFAAETILSGGYVHSLELRVRFHETRDDEERTCRLWTGVAEDAVSFPATEDAEAALSYKETDGLVGDLLPKDWNTMLIVFTIKGIDGLIGHPLPKDWNTMLMNLAIGKFQSASVVVLLHGASRTRCHLFSRAETSIADPPRS